MDHNQLQCACNNFFPRQKVCHRCPLPNHPDSNLPSTDQKGLKHCGEVLLHMNNIVKVKATKIQIRKIIRYHKNTLQRVNFSYNNMIANLPSVQFLALLIVIADTAFGVTNKIEIIRINTIILHRTNMLVDGSQLQENHLYKLDNQFQNTCKVFTEFQKYSPATASSYLDNMIESIQYVQKIEFGLKQAQNQKLSHTLFPNNVFCKIKDKIYQTAQENAFISYVTKVTDLFQNSLSCVYQPGNKTISLMLHLLKRIFT